MRYVTDKGWVYRALFWAGLVYLGCLAAVLWLKPYYMNPEYPMWQQVRDFTRGRHLPVAADLVYLGDSRAKAALRVRSFEEATGLTMINLSIGGATPVEGYYALKNLLQHSSPQQVLLSYAPHHLTIVDTYWNRAVKFGFLYGRQYYEVARNARRFQDAKLQADSALNYYLKPGLYLEDVWNGVRDQRWRSNAMVAQRLRDSGGHYFFGRAKGFSGLNEEVHEREFLPSPLIDYYLRKMIRLAKKEGIRLYWYSMPMNQSSFSALKPGYVKDYNAYLQRFAGPEFVVLNRLYAEEDAFFGDWSHLYLGADKVTADIARTLMAHGQSRQD